MKLLLIAGNANDVFISNMAKWLKKSMDVEIDVFCWVKNRNQKVDTSWYDNVKASEFRLSLGGISSFYTPFLQAIELKKFLKDKHYDIIHCHWITSPLVLSTHFLKEHCDKLFCTFWGGESIQMRIFLSRKMYSHFLKHFLKSVNYVVNSKNLIDKICKQYAFLVGKCKEGRLGATAADSIAEIIDNEDIEKCIKYYGLPEDKKIVQLGYSGKKIHQYIPIIKEISNQKIDNEKIHLLVPMTRGAGNNYCDEVEFALKSSGYTYTLIRNRFLTDEEVGMLRCATDITLQLSEFDGFSRSIVEAFCAKSLVIYGSWLNYEEHLNAGGYEALCADNIHEAIKTLNDVVDNYENYQDLLKHNSIKALRESSWSECIHNWVSYYKEVL